jgi:hypothetical protein
MGGVVDLPPKAPKAPIFLCIPRRARARVLLVGFGIGPCLAIGLSPHSSIGNSGKRWVRESSALSVNETPQLPVKNVKNIPTAGQRRVFWVVHDSLWLGSPEVLL